MTDVCVLQVHVVCLVELHFMTSCDMSEIASRLVLRLVSRLVLGLVSKLHGGYIEASRLVSILVAMSHPTIPLGCTLARCPRGRQGAQGAPAGRNAGFRKARSDHVFHRKMTSRGVTRLIEHTSNGMEIMLLIHNHWKALWQTLWMD